VGDDKIDKFCTVSYYAPGYVGGMCDMTQGIEFGVYEKFSQLAALQNAMHASVKTAMSNASVRSRWRWRALMRLIVTGVEYASCIEGAGLFKEVFAQVAECHCESKRKE